MLPMSLIFSFAFFSSNCFIPNSDFYEICFYRGIRVVTAWQGFLFLFSYLVIARQEEDWAFFFCIDCWLNYFFFSFVDGMFEENQEVESSSSSTSSQTTQGGITRMGMVGRIVGTSQKRCYQVDKERQPTFQKFFTSRVHQIMNCGHILSNTCFQRMLIYFMCDASFCPHDYNRGNCKV